jgi:L-threonylcarbamoyladenylate synthase
VNPRFAARRILRAGGLVAFPTETVYGLGADAERRRDNSPLSGERPSGESPVIVHFDS